MGRQQPMGLGLSNVSTAGDEPAFYRDLLDRLSAVLHNATIEGSRLQTRAFHLQIDEFRRRLQEADATAAVDDFPEVCDEYFARAHAYLLEREREYLELIDALRDTLGRLSGQSDAFHAELRATSGRMEHLTEIDDLRLLKERVLRESTRLKEATEQQRRQEEQTLSGLTRRIESLQVSLTEAQEQAATDPLTGVANRGGFDRTIQRWMERRNLSGESFVLALSDIDHFKTINDTHGHPVGDRVIACTAQWLQAGLRGSDFVARYGGEEFALLFSSTTLADAAARVTERLQTLAARPFDYDAEDGTRSVSVTLSAGIAEAAAGDTVDSLIRRADEGLYQAKRRGRNRVIVQKRSALASLFR